VSGSESLVWGHLGVGALRLTFLVALDLVATRLQPLAAANPLEWDAAVITRGLKLTHRFHIAARRGDLGKAGRP